MSSKAREHNADSWVNFSRTVEANKLPHAFLITGEFERSDFALGDAITGLLLCSSPSKPCQNCKSCKLRLASNHPDLKILDRGDDKQIKVEKVREIIDWATKSSVLGGIKLCLIPSADHLNVQAQNGLLKVLEEPPERTFFCLISNRPQSLLSTVRSRCQTYKLKLPFGSTPDFQDSKTRKLRDLINPMQTDSPAFFQTGGRVPESLGPESERIKDLICSIINGSVSPFFGAGEIDRLSKLKSLEIFYCVAFDAMVIQKVGLDKIKCPSILKASELLSSAANFDELSNIIDYVNEGISMSRGFSNINQSKLTERICEYISNL